MSPVPPVPPDPTNRWADDPGAAELGRILFYDRRFSGSGHISCATCHQPARAWTDGLPLSRGVAAQTARHAPSLHNVAHQRWLFWDGRADSLWAQALGPLEDEREHAGSRQQYAQIIYGDPELRHDYEAIFGPMPELSDNEAVTLVFVHMGKAIAAFERRLVSTRAPFDVFVEGLREDDPEKLAALDASAQAGIRLFLGEARCHLCHHGPLFTDLEFHNTGLDPTDPGRAGGISELRKDPFNGTGRWSDDPGGQARYKVDNLQDPEAWIGAFKTPSLRNVAATAPYMHGGQLASLREVILYYSTLRDADLSATGEQVLKPLHLNGKKRRDLEAFLTSLTDDSRRPDQLPP